MGRLLERFGPWAIVTGASAGMGEEYARQLARAGLSLVIVARRKERLAALAEELTTKHGVDIRVAALDLSARDFHAQLQATTEDIEVGLLVNNAGVARLGDFIEADLQTELNILDVNLRATVILTHQYAKEMAARSHGGIILVSSVGGSMAVPGIANYSATKSFLRMFGEAMHVEMAPHGVSVLTVVPGVTRSEFTDGLDINLPIPIASAKSVVHAALKNIGRKPVVAPGLLNAMMVATAPLMPRAVSRAVVQWMNRGINYKTTAVPQI